MDGSVQSATQHWVRALPSVALQVSQQPQVLACPQPSPRVLWLPVWVRLGIVDAFSGSGDCGCHQCEQDGSGLADQLADFADALASASDALLETAPETRRKRKRSESPKRKGLQRIDRSSVSSRKRTAATDVPSAPRRRGENRSASSYNRPRSYMTTPLPQNADVVDLT